jgi:hypothetical protein
MHPKLGHVEDLGANGKIILENDVRKIGLERVNWVPMVQDRGQWRTLVNTVMNLRKP